MKKILGRDTLHKNRLFLWKKNWKVWKRFITQKWRELNNFCTYKSLCYC